MATDTQTPSNSPANPGDLLHIRCETCGAEISVEPQLRTTTCPYCASPAVVERAPAPDRPDPSFVLAFEVTKKSAVEAVQKWIQNSSAFAKKGFRDAALENTRGVYMPAYLFNAVAHANFDAQIGENYTVQESYYTTDSKGNRVRRTRTVTKTEHRRLRGPYASYLIDILVTATRGISNEELEITEPFDFRMLRPYDPALLSGWIAEEPTLSRKQCMQMAHDEGWRNVGRSLVGFMPGDSHHGLEHQTELSDEELDLILLPIWVFAARYSPDQPPVRILVNGQTKEIVGKVPKSWSKVFGAVLAFVAVVVVLVLILTAVFGVR